MDGTGQRSLAIRFAGVSFIAIASVVALFVIVSQQMMASGEERRAAEAASGHIAAPLAAIMDDAIADGAVDGEERARLDAMVWPLSVGTLEGIRVRGADGAVLYEGGVTLPAFAFDHHAGDLATDRVAEGARDLLVTRDFHDSYVIEVAEDAGAIATPAPGGLPFIAVVVGFGLLGWALLQAAFWFGISAFAQSHRRLAYLYERGQQLRSSLDLHDVLADLSENAASLGGGALGLVALYDETTSEVMLRATFDRVAGSALHQRAIDEWFIRRCIATNEPIEGTNSSGSYRHLFGHEREVGRDARVFCAPMAIRDRVIGAVAVVREDGRGFTSTERELVSQLAAQAVTAVEQSVLFAKVRADAEQIETSYDSTLKALMVALDAKDEVTEGHCERVAKLTTELARRVGVNERDMIHIERGALLHDVGKIGVPDGILKKPLALNDSEWEAMRKHPLLAGLMVSKIGFLEPALPILLYHHERFDGTGYPFGLAADNIPLEARIFSVIDAYDAMTSDRPYRTAMKHFEAMEEIRANSGTQFDPEIVAAFQELIAARPELREHTGRRVLGIHDLDERDLEGNSANQHVA